MKKTAIIAMFASAVLLLSGCGVFQSFMTTNPQNGSPTANVPATPGSNTDATYEIETHVPASLQPIDYEYDFDAHDPELWAKAYWAFLEDEIIGKSEEDFLSDEQYFLADIDDTYNEYTPELCIRTGTCEADYQLVIFAYDSSSGEVVNIVKPEQIPAGHAMFYIGPSGDLYSYAGHMGYLTVVRYSDLSNDPITTEVVYSQDINQGEAEYTPISEIFGEEAYALSMFPIEDASGLTFYLSVPYATCAVPEQDAADTAFYEVLHDQRDLYVVGDQSYMGKSGKMKFSELLQPGAVNAYDDSPLKATAYCYNDANFDGQEEMLIALESPTEWTHVLLSYQEGGVYGYVLQYVSDRETITVCNDSAYHNWYTTYEGFFGLAFDKDRMILLYSGERSNEDLSTNPANQWKLLQMETE